MEVVGTCCHVGGRDYGIVKAPLNDPDGGQAKENLDDEADVEGVLHDLLGGLVLPGVDGEVVGVDAEPHTVAEAGQAEADEGGPVLHSILYYIKMNN